MQWYHISGNCISLWQYFAGMQTELEERSQDISLLKPIIGPDTTFNWHVDNFSKKLNDAVNGKQEVIFSSAFYSHPNGYRMRIQLYPNGYQKGKGGYLSLFTGILHGPFDHSLEWPYTGKFQVSIVNPFGGKHQTYIIDARVDGNLSCWGKPNWGDFPGANDARGWLYFVSHAKLHEYLQGDKLLISVKLLK